MELSLKSSPFFSALEIVDRKSTSDINDGGMESLGSRKIDERKGLRKGFEPWLHSVAIDMKVKTVKLKMGVLTTAQLSNHCCCPLRIKAETRRRGVVTTRESA